MDFEINFLSFYVISVHGEGENISKSNKHFQTLDHDAYENSTLKDFLDGELAKINKRKVERHPKSENAPTKIGRFITEEGHELTSNPNYNVFTKVRNAATKEEFQEANEAIVGAYADTAAIRGGVLLIISAKLRKYLDEPFLFIMKCDFEPKVASISDESTLIRNVEMAITTKNMKSIQYPYMPEEGIIEEQELKIHQSSHARYFEDFLKYVEYGESMPEIIKSQVLTMVQSHIEDTFESESEEREKFETAMDVWASSPKRELQERLSTEQVTEAAAQITELTPEAELKMKLDHISIKGLLSDYGDQIHLAKINEKYVLLIEADMIQFEQGYSPIELLRPDELDIVLEKMKKKQI